jgi:hypothetical protein
MIFHEILNQNYCFFEIFITKWNILLLSVYSADEYFISNHLFNRDQNMSHWLKKCFAITNWFITRRWLIWLDRRSSTDVGEWRSSVCTINFRWNVGLKLNVDVSKVDASRGSIFQLNNGWYWISLFGKNIDSMEDVQIQIWSYNQHHCYLTRASIIPFVQSLHFIWFQWNRINSKWKLR